MHCLAGGDGLNVVCGAQGTKKPAEPAPRIDVVVCSWPEPELLAVISVNEQFGVIGRSPHIAEGLLGLVPRDLVAQFLQDREQDHGIVLFLGHVRMEQVIATDSRFLEPVVVQQGPLGACERKRPSQLGLPDSLSHPQPRRTNSKQSLQLITHESNLLHAVSLGEQLENRLIEAAADQLDLPAVDQCSHSIEVRVDVMLFDELQQRS